MSGAPDLSAVREEMRRRRRRLDPAERARAEARILRHLLRDRRFRAARRVGLYWSVGGEVDLSAVLPELWASGRTPCLPRVSPPLDHEQDGERPYLVTYEQNSGDRIMCTLMRGNSVIETVDLVDLQDLDPNASRLFPDVDADGEVFVLAFCQPPGPVIDYDVFASTIGVSGDRLTSAESPVALGTGEGLELLPRIATTHSSGGERRRSMCVWNQQPAAGAFDISAALYEAADAPLGVAYCEPLMNSYHGFPEMWIEGSPSLADADLTLHVDDVPPGSPGIFYFGRAAIEVPFGDGKRCVGGAVQRMFPFVHADCAGRVQHTFDFSAGYASSLVAGDSYWQLWYRDPNGGPAGFNLSGAWQMTLEP